MSTAFVLGNGVSRASIDPTTLECWGPVYGCNALYRTYAPHALVATDAGIASEIQASGYARRHRFHTRRPEPGSGALPVPQPYFGHSSGPIAVALAVADHHQVIYLLGFDMGPDTDGRFNNLYAGTDFYKPRGAHPTFTGNWLRQLVAIINNNQDRRFVRVIGATTAGWPDLDRLANLQSLPLEEFSTAINTTEDT